VRTSNNQACYLFTVPHCPHCFTSFTVLFYLHAPTVLWTRLDEKAVRFILQTCCVLGMISMRRLGTWFFLGKSLTSRDLRISAFLRTSTGQTVLRVRVRVEGSVTATICLIYLSQYKWKMVCLLFHHRIVICREPLGVGCSSFTFSVVFAAQIIPLRQLQEHCYWRNDFLFQTDFFCKMTALWVKLAFRKLPCDRDVS